MLFYILVYVGIGLILALPLLSVSTCVGDDNSINTKEVFLTIFFWPWLWVLLGKLFVEFVNKSYVSR